MLQQTLESIVTRKNYPKNDAHEKKESWDQNNIINWKKKRKRMKLA